MPSASFFLGVINGLGIFSLLTIGYGLVLRQIEPGLLKSTVVGLLFGVGASLSIANAIELAPGLRIDPRAVMLVLVGVFGGGLAATITTLVTLTTRLWVGGSGAVPGAINIVLTVAIGVAFARLLIRNRNRVENPQLLLLGLISNVPLLCILLVPVPDAASILLRTIGPMTIADVLGVLVLGSFLRRERAAFMAGRALEVEASTDPLTALPNRRSLEKKASAMIEEARQSLRPVSVLVIDIDRFKQVNDRFGHDTGDRILKEVADVVRKNVRQSDAIARFGGEEVVVAMPNIGAAAAAIVAERIRTVVDWDIFHGDRETGNVTVSIGVASQSGTDISFKRLFKSADEALYIAKERGRNRIEIAMPAKTLTAA